MSNSHFSNYVSPNIVIVPTVSFCGPALKMQQPDVKSQPATHAMPVTHDMPVTPVAKNRNSCVEMFPIENFTKAESQPRTQAIPVAPVANNKSSCSKITPIHNFTKVECQSTTQTFPVAPVENNNSLYDSMFPMENINDTIKFSIENNLNSVPIQEEPKYTEDSRIHYLEDSELRVKKTLSWASNYLQSIGQSHPKVIKLTNSAQQKFISKVEDGNTRNKMQSAEKNANKNLFKPTFRYLDVAPNSFEQRSDSSMQSYSATTDNSNNNDTNHPIKLNLLYNKQYTDTESKVNNLNIDNSKTSVFIKPNIEKSISRHSYSKSGDQNNMDNEKCVTNLETQHFEKSISKPSHSKSREINNIYKEKHDKDIKNTNSMRTPNRDIKRYVGKDRNKTTKESKLLVQTKIVDKCPSKLRHKSKDELQALALDRIKIQSKNDFYSDGKGVLETRPSKRNKPISEKQAHSRRNKTPVNNLKIKHKSRENTVKKNTGNEDRKIKSIPSTNNKNNLKSMNSNENSNNKTSEIPHSTPIKSVVQVPNNYDLDSSFKTVPENNKNIKDLRTKLKRKYQNSQTTKRDNLVITVQNDNNDKDINKQPAAERKTKSEKKTKKYKRIKLVINVVCEKCSESSESDSDFKNNEECPLGNVDLSFLDDFNIDDIVESLNDQEDKVNDNIYPSHINDSKNITESLDSKQVIKNEILEKECPNLQNRFNVESPEQKMHFKQIINALEVKENNNDKNYQPSEITGNVIRTSNNIIHSGHHKVEKSELRDNLKIGLETKTSNKVIISPIKLETNQNNNKNDVLNLDITSDICGYNVDEKLEKCFHLLDNNKDKELIDSKLHEVQESNVTVITNITSETKTKTEATNDGIIIDLTQIETGMPQKKEKTSLNNDIVNARLLKELAAKQRKSREISNTKAIIDLTESSENTLKNKKDVANSVIHTSAYVEPQLKTKDTSTICNTKAQSTLNTSLKKYNTEEDKDTKVTVSKNVFIDLTIPTEITPGLNNKAIKTSDINIQKLKTQQPKVKKNKAKDNIPSQSIDTALQIKNNVEVTSAKNKVSGKLLNNAAIKNETTEWEVEHKTVNVCKTEIAAESCQHNMNKLSLKNPAMQNVAKIGSIENDIFIGQAAEIAPAQQNKVSNFSYSAKIEKDSNVSRLQQLKAHETLLKNAEMKNTSQDTSVKNEVVDVDIVQIATGSHDHETKMSSKNYINAESTEIASSITNNIKIANSLTYQQVCSNKKPTSKQEQLKTSCEDVLSITGSLDENLTVKHLATSDSYKSPIYSPTSSIKTLLIFDAKEKAATETVNAIPESKATDTKTEGKSPIDMNKEKSDSTVTAKLNCKKNEQLLALENRMLGYLGAKYSIESLISHGKFSKIYLCKDEKGRNYALKVLNKGNRITGCRIEDMLKDLQKDIPKQNNHCVFLINGFAMLDQWCHLMDYYPKNLQEVLYENGKCFHVDVVQMLARQLVSAVFILRNNNIMHLDIKPSHILMNISNNRLKLAGFDESQYLHGLSVLPCVGTVNYRAPEVILGYPYFGKIDVWSTALVIYEMCTARQLFPGHYNNDILYKQMCTLGNIPYEMVFQSVFSNKHYRGACFARRYGPAWHQCDLINEFNKSMRLATSLFEAYHRDWANFLTRRQKADDSAKLRILRDLLEEMLILDPNYRTPIEFVYVNPFIYETFNTCM